MTATNEDALEAAVREHTRLVYRIAYSVSRNHHDAEDATQETFMRVLRYRRKLRVLTIRRRGSHGLPGGWRSSRRKNGPRLGVARRKSRTLFRNCGLAERPQRNWPRAARCRRCW